MSANLENSAVATELETVRRSVFIPIPKKGNAKECSNYCTIALISDGGSEGKVSVYNAGDPSSIPGLGRSPGEGNGNPLQYYCL